MPERAMLRYDPSNAEVLVFTFKEGLLSAVAHDLKLRVTKFTLEVEGSSVKGEFDADSLKVVAAMKDGRENPAALISIGDIEKNMRADVLEVKKHQSIRFESSSITASEVVGRLTLHGVTKEVRGARKDGGGKRVAEFQLDQRDFGIKPYSAMLGTLKLKPEIVVRVTMPA